MGKMSLIFLVIVLTVSYLLERIFLWDIPFISELCKTLTNALDESRCSERMFGLIVLPINIVVVAIIFSSVYLWYSKKGKE